MTTSAINASAIDETYPVAGVDNNSQGFRDNFTNIKTGLETAASEITGLLNNAALKNQDNDFNGHLIGNAVYNKVHGLVYIFTGTIGNGALTVNATNGPLQVMTLGAPTEYTLTFQDWPGINQYAKIKLHIFSNQSSTKTIHFATSNSGIVKFESGVANSFIINADDTSKVFEAWTYNGGNTVYVKLIGTY
jgi:hypothetical protein